MAPLTLRGSVQQSRFAALVHPALLATLLGTLACGDEGTGEYAAYYYDGNPGAGGALYRPLQPTSPGVAGTAGLDPVPGSGGFGGYSPGVAGAPSFAGRAGAGGLGSDAYDPYEADPYSGSAGTGGSSGF